MRQERGLSYKRQSKSFRVEIKDTKTSPPRIGIKIPNGSILPDCKKNVLGVVSLLNSISKRIDTTAKETERL